jgi:hypothetical protein
MKLTREEVYKIIDGERDYQDERWPHDRPEVGSHNVATYILFMRGYINKAIQEASFGSRHEVCLPNFRKIAALAVRCMEGHGAAPRLKLLPGRAYDDPLALHMKPERSEIYSVIDGERDYQDTLGPNRTAGKEHQVGSYLLMLNEYVAKAQRAWTDGAGDVAALDVIRKIAGICVRCMEVHGMPHRDQIPL